MQILDIYKGADYPKSLLVTADKTTYYNVIDRSPLSYVLVDEIAPMPEGVTTETHVSMRLHEGVEYFSKEDTAKLLLTGLDVAIVYARREEVEK